MDASGLVIGKPIYRFRLGRDPTGAYVGELVDDYGWVIAIRAAVIERDGMKVFEGTGSLTNTPGHGTLAAEARQA
jgi:hypothetical protein